MLLVCAAFRYPGLIEYVYPPITRSDDDEDEGMARRVHDGRSDESLSEAEEDEALAESVMTYTIVPDGARKVAEPLSVGRAKEEGFSDGSGTKMKLLVEVNRGAVMDVPECSAVPLMVAIREVAAVADAWKLELGSLCDGRKDGAVDVESMLGVLLDGAEPPLEGRADVLDEAAGGGGLETATADVAEVLLAVELVLELGVASSVTEDSMIGTAAVALTLECVLTAGAVDSDAAE